MKRIVFAMVAIAAQALITGDSASASDRQVAPSHARPVLRNTDRQRADQIGHGIGINRFRDSRRAHGSAGSNYRHATPVRRFVPTPHGYQNRSYGHSGRNFGYPAQGYGHARPIYRGHGVSISRRGFSLRLGH